MVVMCVMVAAAAAAAAATAIADKIHYKQHTFYVDLENFMCIENREEILFVHKYVGRTMMIAVRHPPIMYAHRWQLCCALCIRHTCCCIFSTNIIYGVRKQMKFKRFLSYMRKLTASPHPMSNQCRRRICGMYQMQLENLRSTDSRHTYTRTCTHTRSRKTQT